jgi:predicted nucleic acid-binding protein
LQDGWGDFAARVDASSRTSATPIVGMFAEIATLDTLIAAHAMALNVTLVTNNAKHFGRVSGLKTVNWFSDAG